MSPLTILLLSSLSWSAQADGPSEMQSMVAAAVLEMAESTLEAPQNAGAEPVRDVSFYYGNIESLGDGTPAFTLLVTYSTDLPIFRDKL